MRRATKAKAECLHCEKRMTAGDSFCGECGYPSVWASHDERVQWEVAQWRKNNPDAPSRSQVHAPPPPMPRRRPEPARGTPTIERRFGPSAPPVRPRQASAEPVVEPNGARVIENDLSVEVRPEPAKRDLWSEIAKEKPATPPRRAAAPKPAKAAAEKEEAVQNEDAVPESTPEAKPPAKKRPARAAKAASADTKAAAEKKTRPKRAPASTTAKRTTKPKAPQKPDVEKPADVASAAVEAVETPAVSLPEQQTPAATVAQPAPAPAALDAPDASIDLLREINQRLGSIEKRMGTLEAAALNGAAHATPKRRLFRRAR